MRTVTLIQLIAQNDPGAVPTARAISERIFKIKKNAKDSIKNSGSTPKKAANGATKPTTPSSARKRAAKDAGSPSLKRTKTDPKMGVLDPSDINQEEIKKEVRHLHPENELPAKRVRVHPRVHSGFVLDGDNTDSDEKKYDTDVSEYVADTEIDEGNHYSEYA